MIERIRIWRIETFVRIVDHNEADVERLLVRSAALPRGAFVKSNSLKA
jgi:hypothetical protein